MPKIDGDEPGGEGPGGGVVTIEEAYRRHADLLREIAQKKFRVPPGDAEGLVNDVFASFLVRAALVRNPEKWLVGAVCHASRGYWRAMNRTDPLPPEIENWADPIDAEDRIMASLTAGHALSHLGQKCRETLRLYYVEGYSAAEIAEELGTTTGYVMQLLHSCRKRAREIYFKTRL